MKSLIAIAAASLLATTAVAGDEHKDKDHSTKDMSAKFEKLDQNKDAQLSRTEANKDETLSAQFAAVDQDADGYVSKSEFTARLDSKSEKSSTWRDESR